MSELTGPELRKAACEALGYTSQQAYGRTDYEWWRSSQQIETNFVCHGIENLPAIESKPEVSEPMFLEWCEKNGFAFDLHWNFKLNWQFELSVHPWDEPTNITVTRCSTPSEARAHAIVSAKKKR